MRSSSRPDKQPVIEPQQELRSVLPSDKPLPGPHRGISLRQPPWHVWVLGAATFKLYLVYWAYKNWRDLSAHVNEELSRTSIELDAEVLPLIPEEPASSRLPDADSTTGSDAALATPDRQSAPPPALEGFLSRLAPDHMASFRDCSPPLRAIWMFVPYVNNYLLLTLALGIARIHPDKNSLMARRPLLCSFAVVFVTITLSMLSVLPGAWYLLFLLCILPAAVMQAWLNSYWKAVEPDGLLYRAAFTLRELVVVAVGALCLGYIIVGFLMGPHTLKV